MTPESWKTVPLGEVCMIDKRQDDHEDLPYVGLEHIEAKTGRFIGTLDPIAVKSKTFKFGPQHVLYGRLRPYLNKVIAPGFDGHCATEIFPLLPRSNLDRQYLHYWLMKDATVTKINATCTGARMPRANMKEVMQFEIPLPPLSEQRRLVGLLDAAFAGLATAEANTRRNLTNARELFESYLQNLFDKGCATWNERTLGDIAENLDRRRVPITKSERQHGPIPYYGASGVVDYVEGFIFNEDLLLVSEDGANLLARTYPIAFSISGKAWVNNHAHVLRFDDANLQEWVETYLNHIPIDRFVSGAAQPKLNQKALNSIPIKVQPRDMLRDHVEAFAAMRSRANQVAEAATRKLGALAELKQSILQRAFRGELSADAALAVSTREAEAVA